MASLITVPLPTGSDTLYYEDPLFMTPHPNPHNITTVNTVYIVVETNTTPACGDTATTIINILPQSNYIGNQMLPFNYSDCSSIPLGVFSLTDGLSDTLRTTTDCRKIVAVTDEPDGTDLGSITASRCSL
ncbi:MAG: hypothetical protein R2831_00640 [Chitinophagaceae bacterium]